MLGEFLDLEIRLLVLKYGRPSVLQSLARLENTSFEELERRLDEISKKPARKRKEPPSPEEAVDQLKISNPVLKTRLLTFAREFERKRFLPDMRDAVRFGQQQGIQIRVKSRREAFPKVAAILAKFPVSKLDDLLEHVGEEQGSFARLADAIIRGTP